MSGKLESGPTNEKADRNTSGVMESLAKISAKPALLWACLLDLSLFSIGATPFSCSHGKDKTEAHQLYYSPYTNLDDARAGIGIEIGQLREAQLISREEYGQWQDLNREDIGLFIVVDKRGNGLDLYKFTDLGEAIHTLNQARAFAESVCHPFTEKEIQVLHQTPIQNRPGAAFKMVNKS